MIAEEHEPRRPGVAEHRLPRAGRGPSAADAVLQAHLLEGVSRTFALTIPQLPPDLAAVVTNAYLLCRTVDTIEDEPTLTVAQKRDFCRRFVAVVAGASAPERFAADLAPLLSAQTLAAEYELIRQTPHVIAVTHALNARQQQALRRCMRLMAAGMAEFQDNSSLGGLRDLPQLDRYCYYVAGVVGEMLTALFCEYSPTIARRREPLMALAVSFGQGLQMTNILKDIWEDRRRGACWLPRDVFAQAGFDLDELAPGRYCEGFGRGLERLIGIARGHLENALRYTLLIPEQETGIRQFCLWALGMAVLTLRKLNRRRDFSRGSEVKISRRSVRATVLTSRLAVGHDRALRSLFRLAAVGLPGAPQALTWYHQPGESVR